jgi:uncharacterized protein YjdB
LTIIPNDTFVHCKSLTQITIPDSVSSIGPLAFENCNDNLIIYSYNNSYIQKYAKENKIGFRTLAISKPNATIIVGKTLQLNMNSLSACKWQSSNKTVAAVDKNGKVTAKKKGTAIITASLYGKKYTCKVIVK